MLAASFTAALTPYTPASKRLVIGFSGGVDSTVLLHLAYQYATARQLQCLAVYCNHGNLFNTPTAAWQDHCQQTCAGLGVAFLALQLELPQGNRELVARRARYRAFADFCHQDDLLLLAHHLDDQHETMLAKLARGAALQGLLIPPSRKLGKARLVRPLLAHSKDELIAYARSQQLSWVEDSGNLQDENTRAQIRRRLMPVLKTIWPNLTSGWKASTNALAQDAASLAFYNRRELSKLLDKRGMPLAALAPYPAAIQTQLVLSWLRANAVQLSGQPGLTTTLPLLLAGAGKNTELALTMAEDSQVRVWLRLYQQRLWLYHQPAAAADLCIKWSGALPLQLSDSTLSCTGPPPHGLQVVVKAGNARVQLANRRHHSQLIKLMQQHGIPSWERSRTPQIYNQQGLLLALGDTALCPQAQELGLEWQPSWRLLCS